MLEGFFSYAQEFQCGTGLVVSDGRDTDLLIQFRKNFYGLDFAKCVLNEMYCE